MIKYTVTIQSIHFLIIPKIQAVTRQASRQMPNTPDIYNEIKSDTRSDEIEQKQKNTRRIFHDR